jgi:hypothetical protein
MLAITWSAVPELTQVTGALTVTISGAIGPANRTRRLFAALRLLGFELISEVLVMGPTVTTRRSAWPRSSFCFGGNLRDDAGGKV